MNNLLIGILYMIVGVLIWRVEKLEKEVYK
jgi:predicted transporter